jgi:hypothetical protein
MCATRLHRSGPYRATGSILSCVRPAARLLLEAESRWRGSGFEAVAVYWPLSEPFHCPAPFGRKRENVSRPALTLLPLAAASIALVAVAAAAEYQEGVVVVSGKWKANGQYQDDTNQMCVRTYNSVSGSYSEAWISNSSGNADRLRQRPGR